MKKLILGALCIMASCQSSKTSNPGKKSATEIRDSSVVKAKLIDTILSDVWVSNYTNKTFIVATAAVRIWSNDCNAKDYFYCNHHDDCNWVGGSEASFEHEEKQKKFKIIISKPVSKYDIVSEKIAQRRLCSSYIDSAKNDKKQRLKLDSIANSYSK